MTLDFDNKNYRIYIKEINETPLLTYEEEVELKKRSIAGDQEARQKLVQSNLRLVVTIVGQYVGFGLPLLDLISEGNLGLHKAVDNLKLEYVENRISTYAAWWIKQGIRNALSQQSRTVRLPAHITCKIGKLNRMRQSLVEEFGRDPTDEELAEVSGISVERIRKLAPVSISSLDAPVSSDNSSDSFGEVFSDENAVCPSLRLEVSDMLSEIESLLVILTPREREIVVHRFGLEGQNPKTLEHIARKFKLTRERIRQVQNIALTKLRFAMLRKDNPLPI